MTLSIDDSRTDLIVKLEKIINEKLPTPEAKLVKSFLEQFYLGVSPYDLREDSIEDLYGALLSLWHFIYKRKPGELKLRVYNPQLEQNGWQSSHTVVELVYENKPFILESIRLAFNRLDINIHLTIHAEGIHFVRASDGTIKEIMPLNMRGLSTDNTGSQAEAPIFIEIDKQTDKSILDKIEKTIRETIVKVDLIVRDWRAMIERLHQAADNIAENDGYAADEVVQFLHWLGEDHFTFIGLAEYNFVDDEDMPVLEYIKGTGLGVLSDSKHKNLDRKLSEIHPAAKEAILGRDILLLGKTDTLSTIHRPVYTDFIVVKLFNEEGKLTRVLRFIGLYTATVYNEPASQFPYISQKIDRIFAMAGFPRNSHDGRQLLHIIENLPRDELFQARDRELFEISIGILHLQERQRIRLFIRRDLFGRYFSCLVFVPRELFNSQLRTKMGEILMHELHGTSISFDTKFSESILARIHFMIRVDPKEQIDYDQAEIEALLVEAGRGWNDELKEALDDHCGEERANELFRLYEDAFPGSYKEIFSARNAVIDIDHIENLKKYDDSHLEMSLYRPIEDPEDSFRFKLFRKNKTIPLSDVVPILENMGLRIINERPHEILMADGIVWINDYKMINPKGESLTPEVVKDIFQDAFDAVWQGRAENDGFNKLVLAARIGWRDISILRMYYRYLWQTGMVFSQASVEDALYNNTILAKALIEYFYTKFDINVKSDNRNGLIADVKGKIESMLEAVTSLNEDRIVRYYLGTMAATVRTNFFQHTADGADKNCISIKMESSKVPDLPLPKPLYEIFVYSTIVEGIHLRAGKVARGGLRWSDRHEDFRTEVLGLMKAQHVKNAVIVPLGAKGGFVVKEDLQAITDREQKNQKVINCYKTFVRGLLDITDNRKNNDIVKPPQTLCWDEDDPYLVVAADKGTATFSDIANSVSAEYGFWLGDAFASGGSSGYDHKKMGITARGAWESVMMHFKQFGIDTQVDTITVIGIGDMAGDVFGNGMLLSDKIKLIAAFNHMHIFFDPNPDPAVSFAERKRLFNLPHSTWADYNASLISAGGGIFQRSAKKIILTEEMKHWLDCKKDHLMPHEFIRAILMMKVDLYFNGGIGTFVKASTERNVEVGDRANDQLRINGAQVNARVVCEGGNLGFTQLGRIEYALKGGVINTDAIDNSAGVNCSDNEVNIKILLNDIIDAGDMTLKQRNALLESMTNDVADLVLANNIKQNEAITLTSNKASADLQMHNQLLKQLEKHAGLDPIVEFMPNVEEIARRQAAGLGFTRPEIAVLMAYTKIWLKKKLLESDLPEDKRALNDLAYYFPKPLRQEKYNKFMQNHHLRRAIIATQISNFVVDEMGINFVQRLEEESGGSAAQIAAAYMVSREIFDAYRIRAEIRKLGVEVDAKIKIDMLQDLNRLVRRGTRWFLRNPQPKLSVDEIILKYKPLITEVQSYIHDVLRGQWLESMKINYEKFINAHVPPDLARTASTFYAMFTALDIVTSSLQYEFPLDYTTRLYFAIGARLRLGWFGELIKNQPVESNWDALARAVFRDEIDRQQGYLTVCILNSNLQREEDVIKLVDKWMEGQPHLHHRWMFFISELKAATTLNFTMFAVALRELLDLIQAISIENQS